MIHVNVLQVLMRFHVLHKVEIASEGPPLVPEKGVQSGSVNDICIGEIAIARKILRSNRDALQVGMVTDDATNDAR